MAAWNLLSARSRKYRLHQDTFAARLGMISRVVICASWRIFEKELASPGLARRTRVTAFLEERQLSFQYIQKVTFLIVHIVPLFFNLRFFLFPGVGSDTGHRAV
jgi:hypothetical protein